MREPFGPPHFEGSSPADPEHCPDGCFSAAVWDDVCTGAVPEEAAMDYLRHAEKCSRCSALLRESTIYAGAETEEEEAFLNGLATHSAEGQMRVASLLAARTKSGPKTQFASIRSTKKRFFWPAFGLTAAALLVVSIIIFRPASDAKLLATAYDRQRLSELRIPGGEAVALSSPTRSATQQRTAPSELLQLKLRSQQKFEKDPNDAALRQTLGRIAIVEHDGETARREFEMAQALDPHLAGLKFDFGSAYFELAESNGQSLNYAHAIDYYSQYLQDVHQQDAVALFNRGLSWERQSVATEAIKDFEAALALEKDPGWRREIEQHLRKLKALSSNDSSLQVEQTSSTPASFLALHEETPGQYETYLDIAGREWLTQPRERADVRAALAQLAAMGAGHGDLWLGEMLRAPPSKTELAADRALAQALQASAGGDADTALAASASAVTLYTQANNQPGQLRARAEHIYSLQRMGQAKDCLSEAAPLMAHNELARYAWLQVYVQLEVAACHDMLGEIAEGLRGAEATSMMASKSGLPISGLRATSFVVDGNLLQKRLQSAWTTATVGLAVAYSVRGTSMRQFQLLNGLQDAAKSLDLKWTQAALADAAAQAALNTSNRQIAAYAFEDLALAQLNIGATAASGHSFERADQLLSTIGKGTAASRYLADWKTDRAVLQAREQGPPAALQMLADEEAVYQKPDAFYARLHYYAEYAELLRESHRTQESFEKVWKAVENSEHLLAGIHTEEQRQAWQEQSARAYHVLVLDFADAGQPETALRAWEWLQTAPYRSGRFQTAGNTLSGSAATFPAIPPQNVVQLTLVYARLQDQYLAWSISDDRRTPIRMRILASSPGTIDDEGRAFLRLCSDPQSSTRDLSLLGNALYRDLIAPFQDQVDHAERIQLDLDSSLARIPFAALMHGSRYLGIDHELLFLPSWWTLTGPQQHGAGQEQAGQEKLPDHARLLVVRESASRSAARIPEEYDESFDIAERFPQAKIQTATLQPSGAAIQLSGPSSLRPLLASADLFHYTGHGLDEDAAPGNADGPAAQPVFSLTRGSMVRCRLAVLAACRTLNKREEDAEDVPSFARTLLAAGAGHVLGTQWDVDSHMTRKLMVRFYTELAGHQRFTEALRRAQQSLQSEPSASHPYFWSAFQMVGQ